MPTAPLRVRCGNTCQHFLTHLTVPLRNGHQNGRALKNCLVTLSITTKKCHPKHSYFELKKSTTLVDRFNKTQQWHPVIYWKNGRPCLHAALVHFEMVRTANEIRLMEFQPRRRNIYEYYGLSRLDTRSSPEPSLAPVAYIFATPFRRILFPTKILSLRPKNDIFCKAILSYL